MDPGAEFGWTTAPDLSLATKPCRTLAWLVGETDDAIAISCAWAPDVTHPWHTPITIPRPCVVALITDPDEIAEQLTEEPE